MFPSFSKEELPERLLTIIISSAETADVMVALPAYLAKYDYRALQEQDVSLFGFAKGTSLTFYEWLAVNPEQAQIFYKFQSAVTEVLQPELPKLISQKLESMIASNSQGKVKSESPGDPYRFVDVASGSKSLLADVCGNISGFNGVVVMQDLPHVVESLHNQLGVELMAHNAFNPQPIKGRSRTLLSCYRFIGRSSAQDL